MTGTLKFRFLNSPLKVSVSVGVVTFAVGAGVGYLLGRKNKVEVQVGPDISWEKPIKHKRGTKIIPAVEAPAKVVIDGRAFAERKLKEQALEIISTEDEGPQIVSRSVFAGNDSDWDFDEELKNRNPLEPYILHKDEFHEDEAGLTQTTLTYYEGDNILCDEADAPIYNYESVTGPLRFGHGSGDKNVVYVRNEKLRAEYEILRESGLFSVEVEGLEVEGNTRVKHIQHSRNMRFRPDD